eukprot:COSAG01_NODE_2179_length_8215_cov_8.332553_5_plen_70_part_00
MKRTTRPFWFYAGDSIPGLPIDIAAMFEGSVDAKYLPPAWSAERDSATGRLVGWVAVPVPIYIGSFTVR